MLKRGRGGTALTAMGRGERRYLVAAAVALRLHFGELVLSVAWRAGQALPLGVAPRSLSVSQTALLLSVMFHHSKMRLGPATGYTCSRGL